MVAHLFSHFRGYGVLVGGNGSRKNRLEAVDRIFKRSFNPWANPPTPSAGNGEG